MLDITFSASLETTTGFTLNTDKLNTGVLGYLETPLNASIRSASWKRGRDSILDNFSAGSAQVVFDNRDRLFDPSNTSSTLYGELYPGRAFTLFMSQGALTVQVFSGYVDSWTYDYTLSGDATVTVNVLDAFSYLANQTIVSVTAPAETSGARMTRVLAAIGWPVSKQSIDTGYSTLAAETITDANALDYMASVAQSEFGMFFADRAGVLKFRQRNRVNTFSDLRVRNTNDVNSYIEDIQFDYSFDRVFNKVTLTNSAVPATATAQDSTSIGTYSARPASFDVLISSSTQMQSIANGLVSLYGYPEFIAKNVTINLDALELIVTGGVQTNAMIDQSTIDVGYLTSVYWEPPGSVGGADPISLPALMITGVGYDCSPGSYRVTLQLDYAFGYDSLILDDGDLGRLNVGKLGV